MTVGWSPWSTSLCHQIPRQVSLVFHHQPPKGNGRSAARGYHPKTPMVSCFWIQVSFKSAWNSPSLVLCQDRNLWKCEDLKENDNWTGRCESRVLLLMSPKLFSDNHAKKRHYPYPAFPESVFLIRSNIIPTALHTGRPSITTHHAELLLQKHWWKAVVWQTQINSNLIDHLDHGEHPCAVTNKLWNISESPFGSEKNIINYQSQCIVGTLTHWRACLTFLQVVQWTEVINNSMWRVRLWRILKTRSDNMELFHLTTIAKYKCLLTASPAIVWTTVTRHLQAFKNVYKILGGHWLLGS